MRRYKVRILTFKDPAISCRVSEAPRTSIRASADLPIVLKMEFVKETVLPNACVPNRACFELAS